MGSRVCLVFNLVRQSVQAQPSICNMLEACVARTAAALKPWLEGWNGKEQPKKLFIPLEHSYTKANLCFAGLKGRDSLVAAALQAYNRVVSAEGSLEVCLCIVTKHRSCDGHDEDDVETDFTIEEWVGIDDTDVDLSNVSVNVSSELLVEEEELFHDDLEPDETEHEDYMGNYGPSDEYWYHMAMIVIWPKRKTALVACNGDFMKALRTLRSQLNEGVSSAESRTLFKDLLEFLPANPCRTAEAQCKTYSRLLEFCSQIGDVEDMRKIISILAHSEPKAAGAPCLPGVDVHGYEMHGIANEVAKMLALAVKTHGWDACGKLVEDKLMLGSRIKSECAFYAKLALEFHGIGMHDAAVCVAARAHALVCNSDIELPVLGVGGMMVMLFTLQKCHESLAPDFVDYIIREAKLLTLCAAIVKLKEAGSNGECGHASTKLFCLKSNPLLLGLFTKLCGALTSCELTVPAMTQPQIANVRREQSETMKDYIVRVMEAYVWLDNSALLESIVKSIVSKAQTSCSQVLLMEIISSCSFWRMAGATPAGCKALRMLFGERIRMLSSKAKPVFSWCQPSAVLPGHAAIEAFLRGPLEKITYNGPFAGLADARSFALRYFGTHGTHQQIGYSATAREGGKGRAAYCTIVKTRRVFENVEKQWQACQEELARLKKSLEGISTVQEEEACQENANVEGGRVMEERCLFEVKRLKTIPVIDLT